MSKDVRILKTINCTLEDGCILWYVNYTSIMLFFKKIRKILKENNSFKRNFKNLGNHESLYF